jgi:uncharacterized protein YndB with AHSA1/START domain
MEQKTKINAEEGRQDLMITRDFDLPVELLFRATVEPEIVEQWMGTKVLKMENKKSGAYQFETKNAEGKVVFKANGVIHEFIPNQKIIRTFEMENAPFAVQLEFVEFEKLTEDTSRINIHSIYKSAALRDQVLRFGFSSGINMAHNRLQEIVGKLKKTI